MRQALTFLLDYLAPFPVPDISIAAVSWLTAELAGKSRVPFIEMQTSLHAWTDSSEALQVPSDQDIPFNEKVTPLC